MITVTLYTRKDCHLCEQAQLELNSLQNVVPHELKLVDVDGDAKLQKAYGQNIPVIVVGPYTLKAPIERQDLEITLRAVQQGHQQDNAITSGLASGQIPLGLSWTSGDRLTHWLSKHYLALLNALVAFYLGMAFLAPVLAEAGAVVPANLIYKAYSFICHQLPYRSWFLFGEQIYYPREAAHIGGVLTFNQATGLSEGSTAEDIWTVRQYIGGNGVGYKVALCQRDVAIYGSILLFGLLFSFLRKLPLKKPFPALHWVIWLLLGIVPMGLDGGTQLVSQFVPGIAWILPFRESTPFLRTLTGFLFGFTTAWFGYPLIEESFVISLEILDAKRQRVLKELRVSAVD